MHATHSLSQCPLHNLATMTIDTLTRTITYASADMIQLLDDNDPTGTQWPSKQDQQLCFTTLVDLQSSRRQKRLLTCEHRNTDDPLTTIIQCADISALEQFYYNSNHSFFHTFLPTQDGTTIILRMNPYGVIQAAFAPQSSFPTSMMIGQPLMRFIHNDDIPMLCSGLRQVTRCQQDDDEEFTMTSFDLRCVVGSSKNDDTPLYHFTTVVTSTQDILCIMRPSSSTTLDVPSLSPVSSSPSVSSTSSTLSLYQLAQLLCHSGLKVKQLMHGLQQSLWHAAEQGLMLLAHYLAVVMVMALQYYRLARHPSFWLETSELALRCLVAETKTRPELDRLFGWLEWSGLPSRKWFGMALDHGSEWFISMSLRR